MNFDDLFAGDLRSLETAMAEFSSLPQKSSISTASPPSATIPMGSTSTDTVRPRQGRRAVPVQHESLQQPVSIRPSESSTGKDLFPWEMPDDFPSSRPAVKGTSIPGDGRGAFAGRSTTGRRAVSPAPVSVAPFDTLNSNFHHDGDDYDDPLSFLEKKAPSTQPVQSQTTALAPPSMYEPSFFQVSGGEVRQMHDENALRKAEHRDLLSSLDAVDMELKELQDSINTLEIKRDTELTELETKIIVKETEVQTCVSAIEDKKRSFKTCHEQRMEEIRDSTMRLIERQEVEVSTTSREMHEAQLRSLITKVKEAESRIHSLQEQRELLLQHHRFDKRGILVALMDETGTESGISDGSVSAGSDTGSSADGIQAKLDAAVRLLRQYNKQRLSAIAEGVLGHLHRETNAVAHEVREKHELAYLHDAAARQEALNNFFVEFILRYRDHFKERAEKKVEGLTTVRRGLHQATEKLRQHAKQRNASHMRDFLAKMGEITERYRKKEQESIECSQRKAHALLESDGTFARSQLAELQHRCEVEQGVLNKLQKSELDALKEQLEKLRGLAGGGLAKRQEIEEQVRMLCASKVESVCATVRELEGIIQQETLKQKARNRVVLSEANGWSLPVTGEALDAHMAVQEREAVLSTLLDDIRRKQDELANPRLRCENLREVIAAKLQEAVQVARQQQHTQESHVTSVNLVRTAWEREQRELLQWNREELQLQTADDMAANSVTSKTESYTTVGAAVDALRLVVGKNRELLAGRAKHRLHQGQVRQAMEEERMRLATLRRAMDERWVRLVEQLLELMDEQERVTVKRLTMTEGIAKASAAREVFNHEVELFDRKREKMRNLADHLKCELQVSLEHKAQFVALQQEIKAKQIALAQRQRRLAVEHCYCGPASTGLVPQRFTDRP
ncbi:hypothetical protein ERJ75_001001200 [Trypanosoma vivax]|uniref:Uncharacterized protein n=1 Tax=Trypanosoma vivax (strain Y486) TaxID=1055687 RepID=G0UAX2_TRYVY|nr:hypothetical protein TRVL_02192 [Trypanosoma vivax]KAH8611691.1 hypothetical protein ERJ75_001001200 [Trypanosoma vivax]CCC52959.1 conserved hypothetical protein [Trypanosoma vivax Y486]